MRKLWIIAVLIFAMATPALAEMAARLNFVGPKSVYAKVGLQSGDEVVDIDGEVPKSAGDVGAMIYGRTGDGKKHTMNIVRNGKKVALKF